MPDLDPVIHAQARLKVVTALASVPAGDVLAFPRLQELTDMTAGNLSTHLRKLEDAGYVSVEKAHKGRTPVTWVGLTDRGRLAFREYREALQALLDPGPDDAGSDAQPRAAPVPGDAEAEVHGQIDDTEGRG
ncbi:ArsR family transcriptional regulator [Egibacter rhizosphaerae]|uniref:ArsR family transcriptional regulator n=1 Tax=Egibacter rhizosphaerae TaxID=1670831 RepID=A0A411YLB3_9ACTN|nr:ArsR family transcriptional regulator [Egibacter rhizosphaerae]